MVIGFLNFTNFKQIILEKFDISKSNIIINELLKCIAIFENNHKIQESMCQS